MTTLIAAALFARITFLAPKEHMQPAFEAGYLRHLQWHRNQRDPWTWHGWTIVSGERFGWFMDATIDRNASDFDAAKSPAADAADNAGNVLPFATIASSSFYRMRPDLCSAASVSAPFATMLTIRLRAGQRDRGEAALRSINLQATCFELISGGLAGTYIALVPAASVSAVVTASEVPQDGAIESIVSEALRYRPDLTYVPEP